MSDAFGPCPHCTEITELGDHYVIDDGSAWHVLCYRQAMLDSDAPDPFFECDYCDQIIWETEPVVKGQVCKRIDDENVWVAAHWHPECTPGEESPEVDRSREDEAAADESADGAEAPPDHDTPADRVDEPPPQPKARGGKRGPNYAANEAARERRRNAVTVDVPNCKRCGKGILRGVTLVNNEPWHKKCAALGVRVRKARPVCFHCSKPVPHQAAVECDGDEGAIETYHKRCYRELCIAADMELPPELQVGNKDGLRQRHMVAKTVYVRCGICKGEVVREDFPNHVADHEAALRAEETP